jgi:hypothetical protein
MVYPSFVRASQSLAIVTVFTALAVGSDFALAGIPNVKLVDTLVFLSAYLFGFRVGASVGVLSELIWAYASPWGSPGFIAPFLIVGEVVYAIAGYTAARVWSSGSISSPGKGLIFGGLLAICAFLWDLETNVATALIAYWPSVTATRVISTVLVGIPFMLSHEVSDFAFGLLVVPVVILTIPRLAGQRFVMKPVLAEEEK